MRRCTMALAAALALPLATGCGDSSTNNPFRNFQITDEIANDLYVYDFDESTVEMRYFPETDQVVGVSTSDDGTLQVGFFGPPLDSRTFAIVAAALDSNGNGNFLDEDEIPMTRESSGTFSETGDELELDLEVDLGLGLGAIRFMETGDLEDIRDFQ